MKITSKTKVLGAFAVAGSGLLIAGAAAMPAMADDSTQVDTPTNVLSQSAAEAHAIAVSPGWQSIDLGGVDSSTGDTSTGDVGTEAPANVAPEVGIGDVAGGDILSGNEAASGNEVTAPVQAPVASGNDVTAPVDTTAPVGVGNDTSTGTGDIVSGVLGDVDTDGLVDDITSDVGLGDILGE